jgi:hypothetical protein
MEQGDQNIKKFDKKEVGFQIHNPKKLKNKNFIIYQWNNFFGM